MIRKSIEAPMATACIACLVAVLTGCVEGPVTADDEPHGPDSAVVIGESNFDTLIGRPGVAAVVEFYSSRCPVCASMIWIIDSLAYSFGDSAVVGASNTDEDSLWKRFSLTSVPTYVFFRDGKEITRRTYIENDSAAYDTLAYLAGELIAGTLQADTADTTPAADSVPSGVVMLDTANFAEMVEVNGRVAMVDFFSPLCPACVAMDSVVVQLASRFDGRALVSKVDVLENDTLQHRFDIQWVPTFVFLRSGVEYDRVTGDVSGDSLAAVMERGLSSGVSRKTPGAKKMLEIPAAGEACRVIRREPYYCNETRREKGFDR